ncbi:MAG: O-succinylhomoserine sulfhydrylase [Rhodospirillales bacterium]|jgi:O-succinylhomoserine sulfhydrylase|nr:O-succinylhomoserine sulfhydrylase [Rhodospirillales bacterium]
MPKNGSPDQNRRPATQLVRGGLNRSAFAETCEAIYMTSGYIYENAEQAERAFKGEEQRYIYSRYANPTVTMLETRLALLEGTKFCRATASGMAAVFASLISQLKAGDRVVASRALFGSCHFIISDLLPRYGIKTEFVDGTDLGQWKKALRRKAACVFLETPSNPTLEIIDLATVAELAHKAGARLVVDNVFATPLLQKPIEFGADLVVYSTTKHMDGQGRSLGGAILGNDEEFFDDQLAPFFRHTGPTPSPFNSWLVLKGLETMELRVRQHCANALSVAQFLSDHKRVKRVLYPGLESHPQYALASAQMSAGGTVVAFEFRGGRKKAFRFVNALGMVDISNNLGDTKSLVTHPASTTHQRLTPQERSQMGITEGMVRLSVGLEDADDIKDDLDRALTKAGV